MAEHNGPVGCQGDIHLDGCDTERQCAGKSQKGIFRPKAAGATMAVQFERPATTSQGHHALVAVAARRRPVIGPNDVMIDPFGDQAACLVDR